MTSKKEKDMKINILLLLFLFTIVITVTSCKKDPVNDDYRSNFAGTYDCTKSNISFEDDQFITEIDDIIIDVDTNSDSIVIMNGVNFLLQADGTTTTLGEDPVFYQLSFEGRAMKLLTYPIIPGFPTFCYINGEKL